MSLDARPGTDPDQHPAPDAEPEAGGPAPDPLEEAGRQAEIWAQVWAAVNQVPTPAPMTAGSRRRLPWGRFVRWPHGVWHLPTAGALAWVAAGMGLLLYALAIAWSPSDYALGVRMFWLSQLLPFTVFACLLLMTPLTLRERVLVSALAGVLPAIDYRARDLLQFTGFDELLHARTLNDLTSGSGLFAANSLLPISPYYPGLESLTGLLMRVTGAPEHLAAFVVVIGCRLLLVLGIFSAAYAFTRSDFRASLVVLFYACCPQFYSFNSQFAYQTLALTLGLGALLLLRQAQQAQDPGERRALFAAAVLSLAALTVTHHVTSWLVISFLWLWVLAEDRGRRTVLIRGGLAAIAVLAIWSAAILPRLYGYFQPVVVQAVQGLLATAGGSGQRQLFADTSGYTTPLMERLLLVLYALICTITALVAGGLLLRDAWRTRKAATAVLALLALAYPATLAGRFAPAASEMGDRASTFLFLPLALAGAAIVEIYVFSRPVRQRSSYLPPLPVVGIAAAVVITYCGGILLGSGADWSRLPGPYLVGADFRSADAENLAAVQWAGEHLPPGSRIAADRYNAALLAGQTRLYPMLEPEQGLEPASLYFPTTWGREQNRIVRGLALRYVYVDSRLSDDLPRFGVYFSAGESDGLQRLTPAALAKFAHTPGLKAVYRHGPVAIYATEGLGQVPATAGGWAGHRTPLPFGVNLLVGVLLGLGGAAALARWRARATRLLAAAGAVPAAVAITSAVLFTGLVVLGAGILPGAGVGLGVLLALLGIALTRGRAQTAALVRRVLPVPVDLWWLVGAALAVEGVLVALDAAHLHHVIDVQRVLSAAVTSVTSVTSAGVR